MTNIYNMNQLAWDAIGTESFILNLPDMPVEPQEFERIVQSKTERTYNADGSVTIHFNPAINKKNKIASKNHIVLTKQCIDWIARQFNAVYDATNSRHGLTPYWYKKLGKKYCKEADAKDIAVVITVLIRQGIRRRKFTQPQDGIMRARIMTDDVIDTYMKMTERNANDAEGLYPMEHLDKTFDRYLS